MIQYNSYNPDTYSDEEVDVITEEAVNHKLIVWNDEVNTFEWVIDTLMAVCGHYKEQAEQCTMLIHYKGKCAVKNGSFDELKAQRDAITERLINATIE
jgi:ATP-dependent Clp protease adaptor protein ClpS